MRAAQGLALITALAAERDLEKAIDAYLSAIRIFGFDCCAAGAWTGVGAARANRFYFNSWPESWMELYARMNVFEDDPVVVESRRSMTPFLLSEHEARLRAIPGAAHVFDEFHAFGWSDVFAIPIHGPFGYQALVSLASFSPVALDPAERAVLAGMAAAIHDRCHAAIGFGSRPPPKLTPRQIACMRWVAAGKSDSDIATLLKISPATAHFHVEKVKTALGVRSRTEAVALLVLDGLL